MSNQEITNLLRLRIAVYKVGTIKGLWADLEENAANEYMQFLFPKSSHVAFFNLMTNIVQKKHSEYVPSDMYDLFHCPVQLEEEMLSFLKNKNNEQIWNISEDPMTYIKSQATVTCDSSMGSIYIGQLSDNLNNLICVMAYHYSVMFMENYNCYPYFN